MTTGVWDYRLEYDAERGDILDAVDTVFRSGRLIMGESVRASEAEFAASLSGTFSRASRSYLDEAPAAYKDIETVIGRQSDLVDVVHTLRPLITLKGDSRAKED